MWMVEIGKRWRGAIAHGGLHLCRLVSLKREIKLQFLSELGNSVGFNDESQIIL